MENQEKEQMTAEELEEIKKTSVKKMQEDIEYLKVRSEYERLLTDIEKSLTERTEFIYKRAYIVTQSNQQQDPVEEQSKERKLKKS